MAMQQTLNCWFQFNGQLCQEFLGNTEQYYETKLQESLCM